MSRTRESIEEARRTLKAQYRDLFENVAALLFRHDPMGINFEDNPDEYESETESILPKLRECQSVEDVRSMVYAIFVSSFAPCSAGRPEHYDEIAAEIWELWKRRDDSPDGAPPPRPA